MGRGERGKVPRSLRLNSSRIRRQFNPFGGLEIEGNISAKENEVKGVPKSAGGDHLK